jgi:hypothetical protein
LKYKLKKTSIHLNWLNTWKNKFNVTKTKKNEYANKITTIQVNSIRQQNTYKSDIIKKTNILISLRFVMWMLKSLIESVFQNWYVNINQTLRYKMWNQAMQHQNKNQTHFHGNFFPENVILIPPCITCCYFGLQLKKIYKIVPDSLIC